MGATDDCHSDPRYSTWYGTGLESTSSFEFSDTYESTWFAGTTRACVTGGNCSSGIVGVWASEWSLDSMSTMLSNLSTGFQGTYALVDNNGIVGSSSVGLSMVPAKTSGDLYLQDAAQQLEEVFVGESEGKRRKRKVRAEGGLTHSSYEPVNHS